jgi:hypothetical protein
MHFLVALLPFLSIFSENKTADLTKYRAYPDITEVTKTFDAKSNIYRDKTTHFCIAKKPGGWYVDRRSDFGDVTIKEVLLWSATTKKYVESWRDSALKYPGFEVREYVPEKFSQSAIYLQYDFSHSIYFGYPDYANDVISDLEGANNLTDTLLESLARAYSKKNLEVMQPPAYASDYNKSYNTMSKSQVSDFCLWGDKIIDTYKRLLVLNPLYETLIGKVRTKLANEYVYLYETLLESNQPEVAAKYLPENIYDPFLIAFTKNMLTGIDKNGILFTCGDNDTFPLWYVQDKLGFRTDVAVINVSLLALPDWIFYWKQKYNLQLSISEKRYRDTLTDFIIVNATDKSPISFGDMANKMESKDSSIVQSTGCVF